MAIRQPYSRQMQLPIETGVNPLFSQQALLPIRRNVPAGLLNRVPTTVPTTAPVVTTGLLDPTGQDRAAAFLKGLGAAGPALMAAGAPTTDPGGRLKGIAAAAQARQAATDTFLQNERARKAQDITVATAQATAQRAALERAGLDRVAAQYGLPPGTPREIIEEKIQAGARGSLDANQIVTQESKIRGDFLKQVQPFQDKVDAYSALEAIFRDPSVRPAAVFGEGFESEPTLYKIATGKMLSNGQPEHIEIDANKLSASGFQDIALIFAFMKALDPRSIVRESEFEMAAAGAGVSAQAQNFLTRVLTGKQLRPEDRREILAIAKGQFLEADRQINQITNMTKDLASSYAQYGIDPSRVTSLPLYTPKIKFTQKYLPPLPKKNGSPTTTVTGNIGNPNNPLTPRTK